MHIILRLYNACLKPFVSKFCTVAATQQPGKIALVVFFGNVRTVLLCFLAPGNRCLQHLSYVWWCHIRLQFQCLPCAERRDSASYQLLEGAIMTLPTLKLCFIVDAVGTPLPLLAHPFAFPSLPSLLSAHVTNI